MQQQQQHTDLHAEAKQGGVLTEVLITIAPFVHKHLQEQLGAEAHVEQAAHEDKRLGMAPEALGEQVVSAGDGGGDNRYQRWDQQPKPAYFFVVPGSEHIFYRLRIREARTDRLQQLALNTAGGRGTKGQLYVMWDMDPQRHLLIVLLLYYCMFYIKI